MSRRTLLVSCWLVTLTLGAAAQVRTVVLGEAPRTWQNGGNGIKPEFLIGKGVSAKVDTGNVVSGDVEYALHPGWLGPRWLRPEENIASMVLESPASVRAPQVLSGDQVVLRQQLTGMVDGDHDVAFERKPTAFESLVPTYGITVVLDFARLVGVHRIRFYPRNTVVATPRRPYQDDYLRGYEIWVNDELTDAWRGAPDELVVRVPQAEEPIADHELAPRYVRLVKIKSLSEVLFEIDEVEVYGTGYLAEAAWRSDLLDLGDRATLGPLRWQEEAEGEPVFSRAEVRVRTGTDDTPILYRRRSQPSMTGEVTIDEVAGTQYWKLDPADRLPPAEDEAHWSSWFLAASGEPTTAPGPRRYVQVQAAFQGRIYDSRRLARLTFDYLRPPIADTLRAEVYPRLARAEQPATFRYAVLLRAAGPIYGYDRLAVDANTRVENIRGVTVNGAPISWQELRREADGFTLGLPLINQDESVLEFTFDLPVFRFGTTFSGRAWNSRYPAVTQACEPGQAVNFGPGDFDALSGLSVAIPTAQIGRLVGEIAVASKAITPNGDGINDELSLAFNLLQLVAPAPVSLEVYDLTGRRVREVGPEERGIGPARLVWDGKDRDGRRVPPGTYVWVLRVEADAFVERHRGVVAVAW